MKVLDLFSGIGGFSLGLERAGMETIAFCEFDKHAQLVLKKHWPNVPVFDDVRTLDGAQFRGSVDVVCGGFPCQPFSVAGKQKGKSDERHLWPEMLRIISECQPTWVIGENVGGFVNMALDACWADLEADGYEAQPFLIPACGVEAHHKRDRCWIVGYSKHNGPSTSTVAGGIDKASNNDTKGQNEAIEPAGAGRPRNCENVANTESKRVQGLLPGWQQVTSAHGQTGLPVRESEGCITTDCDVKPGLGRTLDGIPDWMDGFEYIGNPDRLGTPRITTRKDGRAQRLKQLGNSVVPQIPEIIGRAIMGLSFNPAISGQSD